MIIVGATYHQIGKPQRWYRSLHACPLDGNLRTGGRIVHLNRAAGFLVHPVQISFRVRHLRLDLKMSAPIASASVSATFRSHRTQKNMLQVSCSCFFLFSQVTSLYMVRGRYQRATASFQIRITPPIRPPRTRLSATTPTVPEMPKPIGISVNIFPMPKGTPQASQIRNNRALRSRRRYG